MGGNAIKSSHRFKAADYYPLAASVISTLRSLLPGRRVEMIQAYRSKPDFGDLDVLVESDHLPHDWQSQIGLLLESKEVSLNGPVCSFEHADLQVDIILTPSAHYDFSLGYFAWNDMGNLMGRIAHRHGFKFGHKGLLYPVRDGSHYLSELVVTRDFSQALELLGYSSARWGLGFDTLEDIFEFASSSSRFDPEMYPLEHRSHRARIRDAKRPTYTAFLRWVNDNQPSVGVSALVPLLGVVENQFPAFAQDLKDEREKLRVHREVKARFNGKLVAEWTGLSGRELGEFMSRAKVLLCGDNDFSEWVLRRSDNDIEANVKALLKP
jgi:hypothetical protein